MSGNESDRTTTVKVISKNGVVSHRYRIIFYSENTTGMDDVPAGAWIVYPNPVSGKLSLAGEWGGKELEVTVTDLAGRSVMRMTFREPQQVETIDLSELRKGTYLIRLVNAGTIQTFKVNVD